MPAGDWVIVNPYCKVQSGLDDPSCDIVAGSPGQLIIKDWKTPYDPTLPTAVSGSYSNVI
jgi:hypothetical protein